MNNNHNDSDPAIVTKAKTKKQIASEMGIHPNTLTRYLKEAGLNIPRGSLSPQQVNHIYERLSWCKKV